MELGYVCMLLDLDIKTIVHDDVFVGDVDVLMMFDEYGENDE